MKEYDCVVLGAGVTGLTAAYELGQKRKKILVLERDGQAGGMLKVQKINGYSIEEYYHHVFRRDCEFIELANEIGISGKFGFSPAKTAFLYENKFIELSKPTDLLFFSPLSLFEKLKFLRLMLKIKLIKNPKKYDGVSAKEWIIENSSAGVFEKMFMPLLRSKFGNDMDGISAAWFIERIKTRSGRDSEGESLGYVKGSFSIFLDALKSRIVKNACEIRLNAKVKRLIIEGDKIRGLELDNEKIKTGNIISTVPPKELLKICSFPQEYEKRLKSLEYQGCICVLFALEKKLTDFYWTNIINEKAIFGSVIEHTNFQPFADYGEHLVYLASYPDSDSELWKTGDSELFEKYMTNLSKLIPVDRKDIKWFKIFRTREAGLVYKKGITSNILDAKTPIGGLLVGGMFNSFPDRNINTSVKKGIECASLVG